MDLRKIACYTREGLQDCLVYAYYGYLLIRKGRTNDVLKFNVPGHGDHGAVKFLPQKYTALNFHQKIHTKSFKKYYIAYNKIQVLKFD